MDAGWCRVSTSYDPLHTKKRPRRKASPKPEKAPASGLASQQRVIFSVGADLIRCTVPQAQQGTMFAHWCAQDFNTNEHSYSLQALVKASDRYAATYGMPRAGRSTIASRNQELEFVTFEHREDVGISDKDGRLRRITPSNHYVLDIGAMIRTLHEADPEHVMPLWDKIIRSMEADQDHSIWTPNWTSNWTPNWCYSSTSVNSSASETSSTTTTSRAPDADVVSDLSGEDLSGSRAKPKSRSSRSSSSTAQPRAERASRSRTSSPAADDRAERDSWAEEIISELNKRIRDDVASISSTSKLKTVMGDMAKEYTPDLVEMAMIWTVEGFSPMKIGNPGGFLTGQLPDVVREYTRARNKEASRQGQDPETFNLLAWCLDQQKLQEASAGAMDKIGKLLNKAISTDSQPEAVSLFTKACEIYHGNGHVNFGQSSTFEPYMTQVLEKALKHKREGVFLKAREHCQSENIAQAS